MPLKSLRICRKDTKQWPGAIPFATNVSLMEHVGDQARSGTAAPGISHARVNTAAQPRLISAKDRKP